MFIDPSNYKILAAKCYRNPVMTDEEFEQDLTLIKRVAGKIEKFAETGKFSTRLTFNNFTIACNCFGVEFVCKSLYLLSEENNHDLIMTFLYTVASIDSVVVVNKDLVIHFSETKLNKPLYSKIEEDLQE